QYGFGEKIIFTGNWKLNQNYDLELRLEDNSEDVLRIKGEIISAEAQRLVFELKTSEENGLTKFRLLKLNGTWQADEYNQLSFVVTKKYLSDILTLEGSWSLNKNQQIEYIWEKTELKRKTKEVSRLEFSGYWQIFEANKLTYIISSATNSRFDFRVQMESLNLYPKAGVIKYRLGIGVKQTKRIEPKIISLYGVWKFSRNLALSFDMGYANSQVHSLQFGAEVNFSKSNEIVFNLLAKDRQNLGASVVFTHRFLKTLDAEVFMRLKKLKDEAGVDVGVKIPF
ncbi:MAG: hypothetical protein WAX79_00060, partial [Candidatus Omnitrophota bacterium]